MTSDFEIHTSDTESILGDFVVNRPSDINLIEKGETATYDFVETATKKTIPSGETLTIASGETLTFGLVVIEGTLTVEGTLRCEQIQNNGTLNNNGTIDIDEKYKFEYVEIESYAKLAGNFTITETQAKTQKYVDRTPSGASIDTLLLGIETRSDLATQEINGYWGLVSNVTDFRNQALSNGPRIRVEIQVLAPYEEFTDHTDVQNTLEL
jgi:hypothetical protein